MMRVDGYDIREVSSHELSLRSTMVGRAWSQWLAHRVHGHHLYGDWLDKVKNQRRLVDIDLDDPGVEWRTALLTRARIGRQHQYELIRTVE
jgi:hypothetical protein